MGGNALERLVSRIRSEKVVWVFCGDSITHGATHTDGRRDYVELSRSGFAGRSGRRCISLSIPVSRAIRRATSWRG